jgi:hypothetical protein
MANSDHAASVQGVAIQVTRLNADGTPMQGPNSSFVTNAFMTLGFTPEYTKGQEIEEKGADGSVCVYYQAPDVLKRVTLTLEICSPSPELHALVIGGDVLVPTDSNVPIGYAAPVSGVDANPNGCAIEVWSRAIVAGRPAPVNPFWRWVFPYCKMYLSGERKMENGMLANQFQGWGVGNVQYGAGARGDWVYETDRAFQYARTATAPTGVNDYVLVGPPPAPVDEIQRIVINGKPTGGTFKLNFQGALTSPIAYNATATDVQSALTALSSIGAGNVTVASTGPTAPVITLGTATTGGTFTAGSYYWVIAAVDADGIESVASNELTATLTSNQEQPINWSAVTGATAYKIYRGTTAGGENKLISTVGAVTTYTDTGTAGTTDSPRKDNSPFEASFTGTLAGTPLPVMTADSTALTGGTSPSVTAQIIQQGIV